MPVTEQGKVTDLFIFRRRQLSIEDIGPRW
jgi:hypothetical protein